MLVAICMRKPVSLPAHRELRGLFDRVLDQLELSGVRFAPPLVRLEQDGSLLTSEGRNVRIDHRVIDLDLIGLVNALGHLDRLVGELNLRPVRGLGHDTEREKTGAISIYWAHTLRGARRHRGGSTNEHKSEQDLAKRRALLTRYATNSLGKQRLLYRQIWRQGGPSWRPPALRIRSRSA